MKHFKRIFFFTLVALLLILEANTLVAQGPYSTLTGTVIGVRARMWLDVQSEQDKAVVNFRIGRRTVYNPPHSYPYLLGKKVKVEYLVQRGVPVAYTVTVLDEKR
ncbi:MAG: hypothetical protein AB1502_14595 [Thermodesulfobacteriota bacterium]